MDRLYGPEEEKIKKILTKKILERLQKQKQKKQLQDKAKANFKLITKSITAGLIPNMNVDKEKDFVQNYSSSDYDCISDDEKNYMRKYQDNNLQQFKKLKRNNFVDDVTPTKKRGTSSKQGRSSGGAGGPITWKGIASNI